MKRFYNMNIGTMNVWRNIKPLVLIMPAFCILLPLASHSKNNDDSKLKEMLLKQIVTDNAMDANKLLKELMQYQGTVLMMRDEKFAAYVGLNPDAPERFEQKLVETENAIKVLSGSVQTQEDIELNKIIMGEYERYLGNLNRIMSEPYDDRSSPGSPEEMEERALLTESIRTMQYHVFDIIKNNKISDNEYRKINEYGNSELKGTLVKYIISKHAKTIESLLVEMERMQKPVTLKVEETSTAYIGVGTGTVKKYKKSRDGIKQEVQNLRNFLQTTKDSDLMDRFENDYVLYIDLSDIALEKLTCDNNCEKISSVKIDIMNEHIEAMKRYISHVIANNEIDETKILQQIMNE